MLDRRGAWHGPALFFLCTLLAYLCCLQGAGLAPDLPVGVTHCQNTEMESKKNKQKKCFMFYKRDWGWALGRALARTGACRRGHKECTRGSDGCRPWGLFVPCCSCPGDMEWEEEEEGECDLVGDEGVRGKNKMVLCLVTQEHYSRGFSALTSLRTAETRGWVGT